MSSSALHEEFGHHRFYAGKFIRFARYSSRQVPLESTLKGDIGFKFDAPGRQSATLTLPTGGPENAVSVQIVPEGSIYPSQPLEGFTCGGGMANSDGKRERTQMESFGDVKFPAVGAGGPEDV